MALHKKWVSASLGDGTGATLSDGTRVALSDGTGIVLADGMRGTQGHLCAE